MNAFFTIVELNNGESQAVMVKDNLKFPNAMCSYKVGASQFFALVSFFSIAGTNFQKKILINKLIMG